MHGEGQNLSACQVWTWDEAKRVAYGIHRFKKVQLAHPLASVHANPGQEDERPPRGRDPSAQPVNESRCLGCKHRGARTDPEHRRIIGECGYPYDEPVVWKCIGCRQRKNKRDDAHIHIPGECRIVIVQERKSAPRRGQEPHGPRRKATDDVTTHLHPAVQICQILHPQVEHHPVGMDNHYQVVRHPHEALIQFNEFAARTKMSKWDPEIPQIGCPLT